MARSATAIAETSTATAEWLRVDTVLAQKWLETMNKNRAVTQAHVIYLSSLMRDGWWEERAADPIKFDEGDRLMDGQHRLWAIIETGLAFQFLVVRGVPARAMSVFDTGRQRNLKDFLTLNGEMNAEVLAPAIRLLIIYEEIGQFAATKWLGTKHSIAAGKEYLEANPGLRDAVLGTRRIARLLGNGRGLWTALQYVTAKIDYEDSKAFFEQLASGNGIGTGSPVGLLRQRLLKERNVTRKMSTREFSALVLKSWNLFRTGARVQVLVFRGGGAHPEEYPVAE